MKNFHICNSGFKIYIDVNITTFSIIDERYSNINIMKSFYIISVV